MTTTDPSLPLEGDNAGDKRVILDCPCVDLPVLRYRSLYLHQCNSYRYFIESYKHGCVFAALTPVRPARLAQERFVRGVIDGSTWVEIEEKAEIAEAFYDPPGSEPKDRIIFTDFSS